MDLPGYGYAKVSKSKVADWTKLIFSYLQGRTSLARVCVLIDSRHGLKESDLALMELLDKAAVTFQIVLTKADKMSSPALAKMQADVLAQSRSHVAAYPLVITTSAENGAGVPLLRSFLAGLALPPA